MNYERILERFNEIAAVKGNAKHPLINEAIKDPDFLKVVEYTLNTSRTFKTSKVKEMHDFSSKTDLFSFLDYLNGKKGATANDKEELAQIASESPAKFTIVNKILRGKTDAGFTNNTMNKLAPGLIPYFPYMRCHGIAHIHKIVFPCFSQLKSDGMYHEREENYFQTRNGKELDFSLVDIGSKVNARVMGECLLLKPDGYSYENRKDGNAIINKAQHSGLSQDEADRIRFVYWDVDYGDPASIYTERWETLQSMALSVTECRVVRNMEEAWGHYDEVRALDLEGTILKNFKGPWKDGKSPDQVKLKAEKECELEVYNIVPGKDKYEGQVGSLCCRSSCGQLVTDVGMGLSDEDRLRNDWIGKIITVKFNAMSKSKVKETWAMDHARLIEVRLDKNEADDLAYIKEVKEIKRKC